MLRCLIFLRTKSPLFAGSTECGEDRNRMSQAESPGWTVVQPRERGAPAAANALSPTPLANNYAHVQNAFLHMSPKMWCLLVRRSS